MEQELLKKLRYKEGRAAVLNAPDEYRLGIESGEETGEKYDFVQLFANNAQEVDEWLPRVIPILNEDAIFWITYPKQSSKLKTDINRDILATMVQNKTMYRPVSNVAVDEKWSALRFRHQDKVKVKNKRRIKYEIGGNTNGKQISKYTARHTSYSSIQCSDQQSMECCRYIGRHRCMVHAE